MAPKLSVLLLVVIAMATVMAQRRRPSKPTTDEWNFRDGSEKVNMKGVANLTEVLDNWRFDILTQMKNLLQNDHQALLPDYSRIQPLSEALDDLYKEFNALKAHLGDLSEKVVAVEAFVDEVKTERASTQNTQNTAPALPPAPAPAPGPTRRRVFKKKAPVPSS